MNGFAIIFFLILVVILVFVIWKYVFQTSTPSSLTSVSGTPASFGQPCSAVGCATGLACHQGICKKIPGSACAVNNECAFDGICQQGQCSTTHIASLGNSCITGVVPCVSGLSCINGTCQANLGGACRANGDCVSGTACDPSRGICQNLSTTGTPLLTGTAGAFCTTSIPCNTGLVCTGNVCRTNLTSVPQTPLGGSCSTNETCAVPLQCNNGQCTFVDDANRCSVTQTCPVDYECKGGYCRANVAQPCATNFFCISGNCAATPRLYQFSPAKSEWDSLATAPERIFRIATGNSSTLLVRPASTAADTSDLDTTGVYLLTNSTFIRIVPGALSGTVPGTTSLGTLLLVDAAITAHYIYLLYNVSIGNLQYRAIFTLPPSTSSLATIEELTPYNSSTGVQTDARGNGLFLEEIDFLIPTVPGSMESVVIATTPEGRRLLSKRSGTFAYVSENVTVAPKQAVRPRLTGDNSVPFAYINSSGQLQLQNNNIRYGNNVFDYAVNLAASNKSLWFLNVDATGVLQIATVLASGVTQVIGNIGLGNRIGLQGTQPLLYSPASCQ